MKNLKIALVHDFLLYPGGAEKVLEVLAEMFPEAPIYTLLYDKDKMRGTFKNKDIRTSFLQKLPKFLRKHHRWLLLFYPVAVENYNLRDFDLVISTSSAWSKGIVGRLNTTHIAYIHSPMRFVWEKHGTQNFLVRIILSYLRVWDYEAAQRPDYLIANSKYTQERIKKYYRRESKIIYPSINNNFQFTISNSQSISNDQISNSQSKAKYKMPDTKYFLIVSRLSAYKKIDRVIEAFNKLELPLVIAGEGREEKYLKKISGRTIKFLGWQSDEKIEKLYKSARAFIFPGVDDFGLAPAEALAHGVPVIAGRYGGALEIVEEGKSGEFFNAATPEVIADAVRRFVEKENEYDKECIKNSVAKFSKERFINELTEFISKCKS